MSIRKEILDLIEISKTVGVMSDLIQGGGGNTSVKLEDGMMAIKASGLCLKDLDINHGVSFIQCENILSFINSANISSDSSIDNYIKTQMLQYKDWEIKRPSIETGFHVVLDKYTIHSHSVYANILACAEAGEELVKNLFPGAIWISYLPPGEALTLAIADKQKHKRSALYFIQNHGVITSASTKEEVLRIHFEVTEKIKSAYEVENYDLFNNFKADIDYMRAHVLFPDQVVYTLNDEVIKSVAAQETIKCYFYILNTIVKNKLTPKFLSKSDIEIIDNMDSEKYRKGLVK